MTSDDEQPALEGRAGITVRHESLRGGCGPRQATPHPGALPTSTIWCYQPLGPVQLDRVQGGVGGAGVPRAGLLELGVPAADDVLVTAGTPLEGAALEIDQPEGRGHCRTCGQDVALAEPILLCDCGSADVEVVAGRELAVASVVMA